MITLYRPGASFAHRANAGIKLLLLVGSLLAIGIWARDPVSVAGLLVASIGGFFSVGFKAREVAKLLWGLKFLALLTVIPQLIFMTWQAAMVNGGRVITAILLAMLFTATTRNQDLIDLIERLARPVKRFGLQPQTLGLLVAMTLNSIAMLGRFVEAIREAHLARGLRPRYHTMAVPLLVLSLKHADEYAEALAARGVEL